VRSGSQRLLWAIASCLLCLPLLLGAAQEVLPDGDVSTVSASGGHAFRAAAAAMRRHDCAVALAELAPLLAPPAAMAPAPATPAAAAAPPASASPAPVSPPGGGNAPDRALAGLVTGFYAQACGDVQLAEERLFGTRMPGGLLEDWRLFLLADSARARGHVLVARAALAKLLGDHPASPLRPRALLRAAALDWERADAERAMALVRQARREGLRGEERTRLDALAWDIGSRLGDTRIRTEAARELLVSSPLEASRLGVAEVFRRPDGSLSLAGPLSAAQLRQRARALLALHLEPNALATLDAMPAADRDLQWVLLEAEILTRAHRGGEALALLQPLETSEPRGTRRGDRRPTPAEREMQPLFAARSMAALDWALAQASDDAAAGVAAGRRGRSARVQAERRKLRLAAQLHLRAVAETGADPDLSLRALRSLYAHLSEEKLFAPAVEALHKLHALDPKDTTGASMLWGRGWQDFTRRNYRGAIVAWSELTALYPDDGSGRRARYWTARCFEALGQPEQARHLYSELAAADTGDFYRRNAVLRLARWKAAPPASLAALASPASLASDVRAAEPWPYDPALVRAQLLSDLGLDDLAQAELELVRDRAQVRSVAAMQAMVLARRGERRKSVVAIREAFPALGGPFQAAVPEEALKLYYPIDYEQPIRAAAVANGLPPALVFGVIRQESAFDAAAQSSAGARGLMQLMPGTAHELARGLGLGWSRERLVDPAWNVQVGASYLRQVLAMFGGNVELALAGYNGGPFRIKRLWREAGRSDLDRFLEGLSIEESKVYVKRILVLSDSYRRLYPHAAG
jgi:soluble lytic murein transglycosylase-like protein